MFLEYLTIVSAKMFRKKFLQPDNIGIIPFGGYTNNKKHRKTALAWLTLEEKEGKRILYGRNGKAHRQHELRDGRVGSLSIRRAPCTSFLGATGIVIRACLFAMSLTYVVAII
jgi:hypothetical protein